jgi:hypothetical protein
MREKVNTRFRETAGFIKTWVIGLNPAPRLTIIFRPLLRNTWMGAAHP